MSHVSKSSQHVSRDNDVSVIYVTRVSSFKMPETCKGGKTLSCMSFFINLCLETFLTTSTVYVESISYSNSIMDSRAVQTHAHEHHHISHNVGSHEVPRGEEHHHHDHEKKSVLKKVKQKAKKIKDTITKHGHHHDHDHDLGEEDEVDEYPEVHGAPIYDSAPVRGAAPGHVNPLRRPGVNFGGTTVMGEPHHEPSVIVVSPTTGINQRGSTDPTRTFVEGAKAVHPKVNLERPMHLEEDPHAPRRTSQAYAPPNYQTKVTDPTGAGGAEIDITTVEKSFSRMAVLNEPKPYPEPKLFPTIAQTHYPSSVSHSQFAPEHSTAMNYPSAQSYDHCMPELSSEVKTQYPKSHNQFTTELSTPTKTPYPSPNIHGHHLQQQSSATKTYPSSGSHDQFAPMSELPTPTKPQYTSTKIHDQPLPLPQQPSATKTQYPLPGSHDQFAPVLSTEPKIQYPSTKIHGQHLPHQFTATKTQYPSSGSHDQLKPELSFSTEPKTPYPSTTKINDHHLPQHSSASATNAQYPSARSHDQFLPEYSSQTKTPKTYGDNQTTQTRHQEENKGNDKPSTISLATAAIADKAVSAKNTVASSLGYGYDADTETTQSRDHDENTHGEKPSAISSAASAIADKAVSAKNIVTSKLGFGDNTETTQTSRQERTQPSTISLATAAIADKAVSAKNTVASKLGYGDSTETTQTSHQEQNTGNEKPSTISSATSAITDKAVTAKNVVASKLGYGDNTETTQTTLARNQEENTGNEKPSTISSETSALADKDASAKNSVASKLGFGDTARTHEEKRTNHAAAPTEYGKSVAQSLTEKLAPVSGKVSGAGSGVKSKVSGTEKISNVGVEQDKGVSVKDYLVDKLRPGDEDRALSKVISETLHKKEVHPVEVTEEGVRKMVSDAVHKREDEPERKVEHQKILGKVTESEEVKRRLGGEDVETEKKYQEMYVNSPGTGVVDKLTGMVGTWFTNPAENQSSQDSSMNHEASRAEVEHQGAAGARRLQESPN
ncbi:hypothetical protein JHK82_025088 [Glycine max]|nr:hypothetical protein JHK82_025088 [Glycine max]